MSIQVSHSVRVVGLFLLIIITACSDGGGGGFVAVSAPIGPMGGQVVSGDGLLVLDIPAGALMTNELITITRITAAEADPQLASRNPEMVYRLEPDGLQFALPILVTLDTGAPATNAPGKIGADLMFPLVVSQGSLETLGDAEFEIDAAANTTRLKGTLSHFSELAGFARRGGDFVTFSVDYPTLLIDNEMGTVTGNIDKSASSGTVTGPIRWEANAAPGLTSEIESEQIFDATGLMIGVQQNLSKNSTIQCASLGLNTFSLRFNQKFDGIIEVEQLPMDIFLDNLMITCISSTGGVPELPYMTPQLFGLPQVSSPESVCRVEAPFPFADDFTVCVAGAAGAAIVDLSNGSTRKFFNSVPGENFFDALVFPPANPGEDAGLCLSGTSLVVERVDPAGNLGVFSQVNGALHLDSTYAGNDPANGGHVAGPGVIRAIVYNPLSQGYEFQDTGIPVAEIPSGLQSVQANAAGDKFLAVGSFELFFIDGVGPGATGSSVGALGSNPRRIRWDPTTGLGAISDFSDDTLTLFLWDGQSAPTVTQTVAVGDGPVGIDVLGNRVVSAGFNNNSYTIIETDANGMAMSTTTNPVPFSSGALQPGHAMFLNDPFRSVIVVFNGDGTLGVIPFAY